MLYVLLFYVNVHKYVIKKTQQIFLDTFMSDWNVVGAKVKLKYVIKKTLQICIGICNVRNVFLDTSSLLT